LSGTSKSKTGKQHRSDHGNQILEIQRDGLDLIYIRYDLIEIGGGGEMLHIQRPLIVTSVVMVFDS
jgi:hypothetical protein